MSRVVRITRSSNAFGENFIGPSDRKPIAFSIYQANKHRLFDLVEKWISIKIDIDLITDPFQHAIFLEFISNVHYINRDPIIDSDLFYQSIRTLFPN